ncbi:chemotaxis protein CheC (plasmid) [Clostridium perfringens]
MSPTQVDELRKIINIASGNASTALSEILKKKIDMNIPSVEVNKFNDVMHSLENQEDIIIGTLLKVLGDVPGNVLLVVKESNAKDIAYTLLEDLVDEYDSDMVLSVFQEIGNILGNSYLNAIGSSLKLNLLSSVPYISIDMLSSILGSAYIAANKEEDYIIDVACTLHENNIEFDINIFFILSNSALNAILNKINISEN